jgi:hypothetical protein
MAQSLHRGQAGTAVIEFAFVMVFLLLLTIGITEIGRAFWYYNALQKAARDGARCLSTVAWSSDPKVTDRRPDCVNLVVTTAQAAGLPNFGTANVEHEPPFSATPAAGDPITVSIVNYSMVWIWSLGNLPSPGGTSEIVVEETMPYTGDLCDVTSC